MIYTYCTTISLHAVLPIVGSPRVPVAWNHCKLLASACGLQGLGVLCTVFWLNITGFAIGSILLGVPFTAITLFGMREARRLGGAKGVQLMAAMTACYALGQILGPPLATHLVDRTGGFNASLDRQSLGWGKSVSVRVDLGGRR